MTITLRPLVAISIFSLSLSLPCEAVDPLDLCISENKNCSEVDIDQLKAEEAYKKGCNAKDYYACTRLGQYYEIKTKDLKRALTYYNRACSGKDKYGCEASYEALMNLCYIKDLKSFCNQKEPQGEYRIIAFLKSFDPKYKDAFLNHNFDSVWKVKKAETLYNKKIKEKNRKLLEALEYSQKKSSHDGADGEGLQMDIWKLKGKERNSEGM